MVQFSTDSHNGEVDSTFALTSTQGSTPAMQDTFTFPHRSIILQFHFFFSPFINELSFRILLVSCMPFSSLLLGFFDYDINYLKKSLCANISFHVCSPIPYLFSVKPFLFLDVCMSCYFFYSCFLVLIVSSTFLKLHLCHFLWFHL